MKRKYKGNLSMCKRGAALGLSIIMGLNAGLLPVNAQTNNQSSAVGDTVAGNTVGNTTQTSTETEDTYDYEQVSQMIADNWEEDYFDTITVEQGKNKVEKDGEEETFSSAFDVNQTEAKSAVRSESSIEEFLDSQEDVVYDVEKTQDGVYEVKAPYQTKRLIVERADLTQYYGAKDVYVDEEEGETILQFESETETEKACESIRKEYGESVCIPDEVFYLDGIAQTVATAQASDDVQMQGYTGYTQDCYSWGTAYMGLDTLKTQMNQQGYTNSVTVAVLDTGIDKSNFMFQNRVISSQSYNFIDNNTNVKDNYGHGTHVSGIIADGTPSNVQIMMLKIGNNAYSNMLTIKVALRYAISKNVNVINMSIGFIDSTAPQCTLLNSLINKAYNKGIPICAAAGNSSVDVKYCYPANNSKTIAVSALDESHKIADYSDYGSKIDFTAPGTNIVSARAGGTTVVLSGTSMSCPHIAAAVANIKLIQSNLSVDGVYKELKRYSVDLGASGKDNLYGWGCPKLGSLLTKGIKNSGNIVGVATPTLKTVKNADKGVTLKWSKISGVKGYYIYRKTSGGAYKRIAAVSSKNKTYTDKKASQGKQYTYAVKAYKSGKSSALSNAKTIITQKILEKVSVKNAKGKTLVIRWKKRAGVQGYQIRYSTNKRFKNSKVCIIEGNKNLGKLTGLQKKLYYVEVRSYRKANGLAYYSSWSNMKKLKLK